MLDIKNCLLVIIDIQDKLVKAGFNGDLCEEKAAKICKTANILNIPTIITEQYPKGLGHTTNAIMTNTADFATIIEKSSFSAYSESEFHQELSKSNKKQVIIAGIELHICVLQTAVDLIKNGYEVFILKDACTSRNKDEFDTGIELLKQYGAKITCLEIVLFQLLKTSQNKHFKEIQALIK